MVTRAPLAVHERVGDLRGDRREGEQPGQRCGSTARWSAAQRHAVRPVAVLIATAAGRGRRRAAGATDAETPPRVVEAPVR